MKKRGKLEIIRDILTLIRDHHNSIKPTPLLRKSNVSSGNFKGYYKELLEKEFIFEKQVKKDKFVCLTDKGYRFLERYKAIVTFIDEFEL